MAEEKTLAAIKLEAQFASELKRPAEERLQALIRITPAIFWNLDAQGQMVNEATAWEFFTGLTREQCVGTGWLQALHPEDHQSTLRAWQAANRTGTFYEAVYRLRRRDGQYRYVRARGVPLLDQDGAVREWVGTISDIQDFRMAQQKEEQLRIAMEAARMAAWDWNTTTDEISWGTHHLYWLGLEPGAHPRTYAEFDKLLHPEDRPKIRAQLMNAVQRKDEYHAEFRVLLQDGAIHWVEAHGRFLQLKDHTSTHLLGIFMEATARKEVETAFLRTHAQLEQRVHARTAELAKAIQALKAEATERQCAEEARGQLFRMLVTAEEDERRRMSRELHDHMGQYLTALGLELKNLQEMLPPDKAIQKKLKKLQSFTVSVGQEVHRIAMALRPTALDDLGLFQTLINHLEDVVNATGLALDHHIMGFENVSLPAEIETTIYRFVQETLNNIAKHSGADRVSVVLSAKPDHVLTIVEDNGKGFAMDNYLAASGGKHHLGLIGMKERITLLGGEFQIESVEGRGTTVFLRIPLHSNQDGDNHE
ncbi:MAG: sensor protein [Verrucomicrobiales bacterium]|nr:sensor protein [Verrucomicrobiales bacterium]